MAGWRVGEVCYLFSSVVVGLFATSTLAYLLLFVLNVSILPLPVIDGSPYYSPPVRLCDSAVLNNTLLFVIFIGQHSFMVRGPVRKILDVFISEDVIRMVFVLGAGVCSSVLMLLWAPMPYKIWDIQQHELRMVVTILDVMLGLGCVYSLLVLDPLSLLGITPLVDKIMKRKKEVHFVTSNIYSILRHPSYAFVMASFWCAPTMTVGRLFFSFVLTAYTLLAVPYLEEPDLVRNIGPPYAEYMKTTPRYIPRLGCPVSKVNKKTE